MGTWDISYAPSEGAQPLAQTHFRPAAQILPQVIGAVALHDTTL